MNDTVSVIVAVYNIRKYLNRCIRSIVSQSYKNLDIILVDDGSTDGSSKICDEWARKDKRISVIHKKNGGLSDARNEGLKKAKGKYICFIDGDDYIEQELIDLTYNSVLDNNADIVIYSNYSVNNKGKIRKQLVSNRKLYSGTEIMNILFKKCIGTLPKNKSDYEIGFSPWGRLYRRKLLVNNGIFFKSERTLIYEDLMFLLDLMPVVKRAVILNRPLYDYCENMDSLTRKADSTRYSRLKKQYFYLKNDSDYNKEIFTDPETNLRFKRTVLGYIRNAISRLDNKSYYSSLKEICNDELSREILKNYPIKELPIKQRLFAYSLKYKLYFLIIMLVKLNNYQKMHR